MTTPQQQNAGLGHVTLDSGGQSVPYLDQWLGQWFIEPQRGRALFSAIKQLNLSVHLQQQAEIRQGTRKSEDDPAVPPSPSPGDAIDFERSPAARTAYGYRVVDGVALLELRGSLMKHEVSMQESTSTVMMRRSVRKAMHDPAVKAVILCIDSPGGTVAGAYELAADIRTLNTVKPVYAHAANLVASAAYLMAAQCRGISAAATTLVGSLGTYGVVYDDAEMYDKAGIKVHLLKGKINGKDALMIGAGTSGVAISDEQLARMQEGVDDLNQQFFEAVTSGPRAPKSKAVEQWFTDAGVWIAPKAQKMGLIDRVESLDAMLARVSKSPADASREDTIGQSERATIARQMLEQTLARGEVGSVEQTLDGLNVRFATPMTITPTLSAEPSKTEEETGANASDDSMSKPNEPTTAAAPAIQQPAAAAPAQTDAKPATLSELKTAFPGNLEFAVEMYEAGHTLAEAKSIDAIVQSQLAKRAPAPRQDAPAQPEQQQPARRPGVPAVPGKAAEQRQAGGTGASGDVKTEFEQLVAEQVKNGKTRHAALASVVRGNPDLHRAYLESANPGKQL